MTVNYKIFTDGSSRGNPGPGGWGAIVVSISDIGTKRLEKNEDVVVSVTELGGGEKQTTNNRMELMAAAKALEYISSQKLSRASSNTSADSTVDIYTDSSYLINGITKWIHGWKKNGWRTKTKEDVLNKDIWLMIDSELSGDSHVENFANDYGTSLKIKWHHIGGHVGIVGNERCDEIATVFADSFIEGGSYLNKKAKSAKSSEKIKLYNGPLSDYGKVVSGRDILDVSHDEVLVKTKKSSSTRSRAKAYSYISMVDGVVETHKTWQECERRVKGKPGAKFKKSLDISEERDIINDFSR